MAKAVKNKLPVAKASDYPATCAPPKMTKADIDAQRRWKAEDALRDIQRVEGYKSDKSLMKDVKTLAREQIKSLGKIT